jgi:hypothetical protein
MSPFFFEFVKFFSKLRQQNKNRQTTRFAGQ